MKRLYAFLLLISACVVAAAQVDFKQRCSTGQMLYYHILADGSTVELTHPSAEWPYYADEKPAGRLQVPARVRHDGVDYEVIGVGENAFYRCDGLTEVILPEACQWIGTQSFNGCKNMKTCVFPQSLRLVGEGAMAYCASLVSLDMPCTVQRMGISAFAECVGLQQVRMPESLWNRRNELLFLGCGWIETAKNEEKQSDGRVFLQRGEVDD